MKPTDDGWLPGGREAFRAGLKAEHELGQRDRCPDCGWRLPRLACPYAGCNGVALHTHSPPPKRLSECEACGKLKPDCVSTTTGGRFPMDVYACAECRGADPEEE